MMMFVRVVRAGTRMGVGVGVAMAAMAMVVVFAVPSRRRRVRGRVCGVHLVVEPHARRLRVAAGVLHRYPKIPLCLRL